MCAKFSFCYDMHLKAIKETTASAPFPESANAGFIYGDFVCTLERIYDCVQ